MSVSNVSGEKSKREKKNRDKGKGKSEEKALAQVVAAGGHGKMEGIELPSPYQPPDGMVTLDTSQVDEDFDWDLLKNDGNKELWIVRLPEGFKAKNLDGLEIQQPLGARGTKLFTISRKRATYDAWSVEPSDNTEQHLDEDDKRPLRAQEITTLSCLLPRGKKEGKLYIAPKSISQHMIITHTPAIPNVDEVAVPAPSRRDFVPKHLLKHRFLPMGASIREDGVQRRVGDMDVDTPKKAGRTGKADATGNMSVAPGQARTPEEQHSQSPKSASKKRKPATGEREKRKHKAKRLKV